MIEEKSATRSGREAGVRSHEATLESGKEFGLYSKSNGNPLVDFKQRNNMR